MVQAEKTQILNLIKDYEKLDIPKIFITKFGVNEKDLTNVIVLGSYTTQQLIDLVIKIFSNFKTELNLNGWTSLPSHISHQDLGNRNLLSDITSLHTQLVQGSIDGNLVTFIDWLIFYQRSNNFWHLSENTISTEKLKELENNLVSKNELFSKSLEDFKKLVQETENVKEVVNKLIADKTQELAAISTGATTISATNTEIATILADGKVKGEAILAIVKQGEEKIEEAKIRIEEERKKFDEYRKSLEELQTALNEKIEAITNSQKTWDGKLEFITSKEDFINTKTNEINDLTGFAAGVSLFHTFQERKKQLDAPVKSWFWGLIGSALLTVGAVFAIFALTETKGDWSIFALNSLKCSPFFILLYFAIRQYSKERAIQEEYAFKSAVALTINAFADKISAKGDLGKDKLILSSVDKIYEVPMVMKEKSGSIFSFRSRAINDALKNLTEVVKEAKK